MNKAMEIKKEKRELGWKFLWKDSAWQERRVGKAPAERYCVARAAEWRSARGKSLHGKSSGMEKRQRKVIVWQERWDGKASEELVV